MNDKRLEMLQKLEENRKKNLEVLEIGFSKHFEIPLFQNKKRRKTKNERNKTI